MTLPDGGIGNNDTWTGPDAGAPKQQTHGAGIRVRGDQLRWIEGKSKELGTTRSEYLKRLVDLAMVMEGDELQVLKRLTNLERRMAQVEAKR